MTHSARTTVKCQDPGDGSGDVIIDLPPDILKEMNLAVGERPGHGDGSLRIRGATLNRFSPYDTNMLSIKPAHCLKNDRVRRMQIA